VAAVVTIRPARTDDAGPVTRIRAESWQAAYAPSGESKSEDRFGGVTEVRYARLLG
jgi:hypothetical protein